ncbi:hypothetical protein GCM10010329_07670 [Streptomyces spiroverticillatus]|uniref:Uncharacterized protein n=1 Tax=Streptomyces finlayi TaxID=67296 RepID=A0A918WT32_9ACTN|nr:hypothetical protein GCM10010329_07670 [Streptomyces spiroverticillatus]GHC80543.1 hypothetical protein GCM10010334_07660 [Streptomyces finlayi]
MKGERLGCGAGGLIGALSGVPTSLLVAYVVAVMWSQCDVGVAPGLVAMGLALLLWFATSVLWTVVVWALGRYGTGLAVLVGVVANLGLVWWVMAVVATPADYPDDICPANVPEWWPGWVPV